MFCVRNVLHSLRECSLWEAAIISSGGKCKLSLVKGKTTAKQLGTRAVSFMKMSMNKSPPAYLPLLG